VLRTLPDPAAVARAAADLVVSAVREGVTALGVATGSSPSGAYRELGRRVAAGEVTLAGCDAYLLDEYVGLPRDHPQSYRCVIRRDLVRHVDLAEDRVHGPDGGADDLDAEARRYEEEVVSARIGVQVLGIGANGHLGFNEPGSPVDSRTRVVSLAEQTRADNARFFDAPDEVPHRVLTQGLSTILRAERLVLIATGERKAAALAAALTGPVGPACPASVLQLHRDVHVLADPPATSRLP
jgi:glucosamine-6-phosphate deaminase